MVKNDNNFKKVSPKKKRVSFKESIKEEREIEGMGEPKEWITKRDNMIRSNKELLKTTAINLLNDVALLNEVKQMGNSRAASLYLNSIAAKKIIKDDFMNDKHKAVDSTWVNVVTPDDAKNPSKPKSGKKR